MLAYPKALRIRVVNAVEQGEGTIAEISTLFGVGLTFVKKMLRLHRAGADLAPRHGGGPVARLHDPELALLRHEVEQQADVTLEELQRTLAAQRQVRVSRATICRALQRLGLPRKKKAGSPVSGMTRRARSSANSRALSRVATPSLLTKWAVTWGCPARMAGPPPAPGSAIRCRGIGAAISPRWGRSGAMASAPA